MKKRIFLGICITFILISLFACGVQSDNVGESDTPALIGHGIIHEAEFGGIDTGMSIDDFDAPGFEYGDSVDVVFSNGYELKDLPYYSGYYKNRRASGRRISGIHSMCQDKQR